MCGVGSLLHLRPGDFPWMVVAGKRLTGWIDASHQPQFLDVLSRPHAVVEDRVGGDVLDATG
ncbi:hypothetical protein [Streptomyces sp. NPDC056661]|uniref:hypothetical protein n=1 Tax=Streptomyces sp. NPDC056661 TaxID=3345898 RepID=UPI003683BAC8